MVLAKELKKNYFVEGFFYKDSSERSCRKYLDIRKFNSNETTPQMMVVMMNPGSSKPCDGDDDGRQLVPTIPDPTQYQVMRVMNELELDFVRVLNLSDLRNPKSSDFFNLVNNSLDFSHSIFSDTRIDDLDLLFNYDVPVIFAWGLSNQLDTLSSLAINRLSSVKKSYGICSEENRYNHARPHLAKKQKEWVEAVVDQLKNINR